MQGLVLCCLPRALTDVEIGRQQVNYTNITLAAHKVGAANKVCGSKAQLSVIGGINIPYDC
jgi:hypothetical protein